MRPGHKAGGGEDRVKALPLPSATPTPPVVSREGTQRGDGRREKRGRRVPVSIRRRTARKGQDIQQLASYHGLAFAYWKRSLSASFLCACHRLNAISSVFEMFNYFS